jgi:MYXO-CTERM domain-containing protein
MVAFSGSGSLSSLRLLTGLGAVLGALSLTSLARADVAPPDACNGAVGTACDVAGSSYDEPGICVNAMCARPTPDGSVDSPCVLCQLVDAGASDAATPADGGSTSGSSSGSTGSSSGSSSSSSSKSSCALSPTTRDGATGLGMLALGVGALAWSRRRRP